jgi:heptaprenyl diphosphate synthase
MRIGTAFFGLLDLLPAGSTWSWPGSAGATAWRDHANTERVADIGGSLLSALHCPSNVTIATELLDWCRNYLMAENEEIKRPLGNQVVCPFVRGSIDTDSLRMAFHPEVNGHDEPTIEAVVTSYIPIFKRLPPYDKRELLRKALLIVFPSIEERNVGVLDHVYANLKHKFVDEGLMIGQFHQRCDERGIYNPRFKVSRSPYPFIAVRHMAIHDILFLGSDPDWFRIYNLRFGHRFRTPDDLHKDERHYVELYERARAKALEMV